MPRVLANAFDPGFAEGDCAYHAVLVGRDGRVFFAVSTHRLDHHARLGCFDPASRKMRFVNDLGEALGESSTLAVPHGKVHVPIAEIDGHLYLATMQGHGGGDRRGRRPYPGFRLISVDPESGRPTDVIHGPRGEGLVAGVMDGERRVYYGLTYPGGRFCRCDLRSGSLRVSGRPCADLPMAGRLRLQFVYPVCRSLGLDTDGAVYGSCRNGSIWRAEADQKPRRLPGLNVRQGVVPPLDRQGARDGFWRTIVFDQEQGCFHGIHAGTQSLFRFDPARGRIDPLCRIGVEALHDLPHAPFGSQLGLVLGPARVLYHISHGPPVSIEGRPPVGSTAYLTSYDIDRGRFRQHGPIETDAGDRVLFAESLTVDTHGNLYALAGVEVSDPAERPRYRRLRAEAAPPVSQNEVYRMMLLRIGTETTGGASA